MTEVLFSNDQFFIVILSVIWLYISTLGFEKEDVNLLYIQFFVAIPLVLMLLANAFLDGLVLGYGVGFSVAVTSVYFVFLGTIIRFKRKEEKKDN